MVVVVVVDGLEAEEEEENVGQWFTLEPTNLLLQIYKVFVRLIERTTL